MRKLSVVLLALFLNTNLPVLSKSKAEPDGKPAAKPDKKQQLVDQIIEAVQIEKELSNDEIAEMKKKQKERLDRIFDVIADKAKMSDEEKSKLKEKISSVKEHHRSMPPELKDKLEKLFDLKGFSKQTTYKVLSEHLDDNDLKTILKFLKSPTGKKVLQEGPDMIGQVVELSAERYIPIIMDFAKQIQHPYRRSPNFPPLPSPKDNDPEHRREIMDKWKQFLKEQMQQPAPTGPGKDET